MNERWMEITGLIVVIASAFAGIALGKWISTAFFADDYAVMFITFCIILFGALIIWNRISKEWR